jgi:predicted GNAT superfamily acetyltransferase
MTIVIRELAQLEEMYRAAMLQQTYWGTDIESIVPGQMLFSIAKSGGHIIAAFDDTQMVGVLIGLLGAEGTPARDHLKVYSKRMVVLPEYRSQGIAQRLKLKQLELARESEIATITWTFDPLLSLNAHFNVRKLGCTCDKYVVDYYGREGDAYGLSLLGSSDRWLVSWDTNDPDVLARVNGTYRPKALADYLALQAVVVNPSQEENGLLHPGDFRTDCIGIDVTLVEIPRNYRAMVDASPGVARQWRAHSRSAFVELVNNQGYRVVDFVGDAVYDRQRMFYALQKSG